MPPNAFSVFGESNGIMLWLAATRAPTDDEWKAYTEAVLALGCASDAPVSVLVVTDGGAPTTAQRTEFVAAVKDLTVRTSVISNNPLVAGVAMVFSWFNVNNKVFSPKDVSGAFGFLQVPPARHEEIWSTVERLEREVAGGVRTVATATQHWKGVSGSGAA